MRIKLCVNGFVASLAIMAGCVVAGPVSSPETFDFDNGQLPAEWTKYLIPEAPAGGSVSVANGRLEFGSLTQGGIYRSINTVGLAKLQVTYDASIPLVSGPSSFLLNDGWFSNRSFGGSVQAGVAKIGAGFNSSIIFGAPGQQIQYYENKNVSVPTIASNEYRVTNSFEDGLVTQSVVDIASGNSFLNSQVAVAGFKLADMHKLFLYDSTFSGVTGWIDNVKIDYTCSGSQVLQNGTCVTPPQTTNNIFLNETAKLIYGIYEDLWSKVGDRLELIGRVLTIVAGNALDRTLMAAIWMVENIQYWIKDAEIAGDIRSERALLYAKELDNFRKAVQAIKEAEATIGGAASSSVLVKVNISLALASLSAQSLESLAHELKNDPPRDDYALVRSPGPLSSFSALYGDSPTTVLEMIAIDIANCTADGVDGLQVALLAAERAWGASMANDALAVARQAEAYSAGVAKANAAAMSCELAISRLKQQMINDGIPNYDANSIPAIAGLTADELEIIRQAIIEINGYSAEEYDSALTKALLDGLTPMDGSLYGQIDDLEESFAKADSIDPYLAVPEPETWILVCFALLILCLTTCNNRKHWRFSLLRLVSSRPWFFDDNDGRYRSLFFRDIKA